MRVFPSLSQEKRQHKHGCQTLHSQCNGAKLDQKLCKQTYQRVSPALLLACLTSPQCRHARQPKNNPEVTNTQMGTSSATTAWHVTNQLLNTTSCRCVLATLSTNSLTCSLIHLSSVLCAVYAFTLKKTECENCHCVHETANRDHTVLHPKCTYKSFNHMAMRRHLPTTQNVQNS